jgi:hypothetical protein
LIGWIARALARSLDGWLAGWLAGWIAGGWSWVVSAWCRGGCTSRGNHHLRPLQSNKFFFSSSSLQKFQNYSRFFAQPTRALMG